MGTGLAKERGKIIPTFWGFMASVEEVKYTENVLTQCSQFAPLKRNELPLAASPCCTIISLCASLDVQGHWETGSI